MYPVEFKARRNALGLSHIQLAKLFEVPPEQITKWETDGTKHYEEETVRNNFRRIATTILDLSDQLSDELEARAANTTGTINLTTYASDEKYWKNHPTHKPTHCALHRIAAGIAATQIETWRPDITIQIIY